MTKLSRIADKWGTPVASFSHGRAGGARPLALIGKALTAGVLAVGLLASPAVAGDHRGHGGNPPSSYSHVERGHHGGGDRHHGGGDRHFGGHNYYGYPSYRSWIGVHQECRDFDDVTETRQQLPDGRIAVTTTETKGQECHPVMDVPIYDRPIVNWRIRL